jgi:hypothetical protein
MKIVLIRGSGLIRTKVVKKLTEQGHEAIAASPNSGVHAKTGRGLAEALARADVVVDVSNSPSFEAAAVLAFFENSGRNLARAERGRRQSSPIACRTAAISAQSRPRNGSSRRRALTRGLRGEAVQQGARISKQTVTVEEALRCQMAGRDRPGSLVPPTCS